MLELIRAAIQGGVNGTGAKAAFCFVFLDES